jgi:hypothetical protein
MITEPIHVEVICKIRYRKNYVEKNSFILEMIDEVEKINSFATGDAREFVLSAYKKTISEDDLIKIINNYLAENIKVIKSYKISIYYFG